MNVAFVLALLVSDTCAYSAALRRHLASDDHDYKAHDPLQSANMPCGCAAHEEDHAFEIDCNKTSVIAKAQTDLEACAPTTEAECAVANAEGVAECQAAFFIIQAHHDFCPHDTLTEAQEALVHDYEDVCL
eukprot:CAMPEP_0183348970 /NCGR_PEP_ID=MMETSP0164_2-20130417/13308_1 /TAXON_ID=221442 /ORGANISM="Coccolithus pelagicus ssp braarudi, Strain PLY182g" /LENGTH=130 /DNA_ID=CAMNT_0025520637 /DNA_START=149 /DNA_END=538 /DNA_ORIENTATION=-